MPILRWMGLKATKKIPGENRKRMDTVAPVKPLHIGPEPQKNGARSAWRYVLGGWSVPQVEQHEGFKDFTPSRLFIYYNERCAASFLLGRDRPGEVGIGPGGLRTRSLEGNFTRSM